MSTTHDQENIPPQTADRGYPESPMDLPPEGWKASLKGAVEAFKADKGTLIGAGMAFYWFLAVFPALLAAVGILGLARIGPEAVDSIARAIDSTLPDDAARVLTESLTQATTRARGSSLVAAVVGIALALWSASAGMVALQTGLDVVYHVPEERTFLKKRARAMLLIGVALVLGGIATGLIVFGQPLGSAIEDALPFGGAVFNVVWTVARWVLGLGALAALFAAFYYFGPNRESPEWEWLSPGGVVASIIWLAASVGFSFYVSSLGSYGKTYGSFTGVVVLLLWLYLTALAILLGGEVNAQLERMGERERRRASRGRRRRDRPSPPESPPPAPPPPQVAGAGQQDEWFEAMRRIRSGAGS